MYPGEKINSISHLVGASSSLIAWGILIGFSSYTRDPWKITSATVYGFSLFFLYLNSTLYHSFKKESTAKKVFQRFDHISIYYLIAGTYTPYTLVVLREDGLGWVIFSIVWGIALIGTIFKSIWGGEKFNSISTLFYVLAGWAILIDIKTVYNKLPPFGFYWLFAGGLFYTIGAFFYLKEDLPRNHEIWHFFVLGGSVCQFVSVFFYVI